LRRAAPRLLLLCLFKAPGEPLHVYRTVQPQTVAPAGPAAARDYLDPVIIMAKVINLAEIINMAMLYLATHVGRA
jgi:hypothetical protein